MSGAAMNHAEFEAAYAAKCEAELAALDSELAAMALAEPDALPAYDLPEDDVDPVAVSRFAAWCERAKAKAINGALPSPRRRELPAGEAAELEASQKSIAEHYADSVVIDLATRRARTFPVQRREEEIDRIEGDLANARIFGVGQKEWIAEQEERLDTLYGEEAETAFQLATAGDRHRVQRKMELEWLDDAGDFALSDPSDPLIDDLLDAGAFSVVFGDSNAGKTFVVLDMAYHVATGTPWNEKDVKRGLVVYVAAEGGTRIKRRLAALKQHFPSDERPLFALVRFPIDMRSNDADLKQLLALIRKAEVQTGEKCVWVIVDTLSRAMAGGDENSSTDMGRVVLAADNVRSETGAHFSFIHHSGKDTTKGARGHSSLRAATDSEFEVTPHNLATTKQRDHEVCFSIGFKLTDIEIGVDAGGGPTMAAIVEWDAAGEELGARRSMPRQSVEVTRLKGTFLATLEMMARDSDAGTWVQRISGSQGAA